MPDDKPIIINSPYEEPREHWIVERDEPEERARGRRKSEFVWTDEDKPSEELKLVNALRPLVKKWAADARAGRGGVSLVTMDLLNYWHDTGRQKQHRLFFAQLEAAETIICLAEADPRVYLPGIEIPRDEPSDAARAAGYRAFTRHACKLATGAGKTTVMGMLAAWSILNKVARPNDKRYSDAVLVVCPNVTIRERLGELDPRRGDASIYRTRDLIPPDWMSRLSQGRVLTLNWHLFEPQVSQAGARVVKTGRRTLVTERIHIGAKSQSARGKKYMTEELLRQRQKLGLLKVLREEPDKAGNLKAVVIESEKYIETDAALVRRALGREFGGKRNILVMNDEAHHAYRLRDGGGRDDLFADDEALEDFEEYYREATVWVDGLDKINRQRGVNRCLDFSATPYFLGRAGENSGKVFPWVVSDFGLSDAIESGLVKSPRFSVRTPDSGNSYYDLWSWILKKLTPSERGGRKATAKPEAVLRYAFTPLKMMAQDWDEERARWEERGEKRPPVFIIVCKNVKLAKAVYEWLGEGKTPAGILPADMPSLRNSSDSAFPDRTIRVDSRVASETDSDASKSDETRWMRFVLGSVGKTAWLKDEQGKPLYPPGFEELAAKLERSKEPPGRDVRCIVSVSMLTEGWDCNTVTHIVGLRPFMSQLLCEQVVGRGLRRADYEPDDKDMMSEEFATVFGVPFRTVPVKGMGDKRPVKPEYKRIYALPERARYAISFPRVEGYRREIKQRLTADVSAMPEVRLTAAVVPTEAEVKASVDLRKPPDLDGPGGGATLALQGGRLQALQFKLVHDLVKKFDASENCLIPRAALFKQILPIAQRYLADKIIAEPPNKIEHALIAPQYYDQVLNNLFNAIAPGEGETPELPQYERGRGPGDTADVDFRTRREIYQVHKSHLNAIASDSKLERQVAHLLDVRDEVAAFVKNERLGFAIPYMRADGLHEYLPDFIVRLKNGLNLILETKGFDPRANEKADAARRWVKAVNSAADNGKWDYQMSGDIVDIETKLTELCRS